MPPANRINDAPRRDETRRDETRRGDGRTGKVSGEGGRGRQVRARKSNLIFPFVFRRQHVRARKYRPAFTLLRVACETRISYLPAPRRGASLPTVFPPLIPPSRVKGGGERGRVEGDEDENAENGRNAKWQLRLDIRRPARRKLSARPRKKPATELFKSHRPSPTLPPFFRVPPFYSPGRFSRGNLISPSRRREEL